MTSLNINEAGVLHSRDFLEHNNSNIRQAVTGITQRNKNGGVWGWRGNRVTHLSEFSGRLQQPQVTWANWKITTLLPSLGKLKLPYTWNLKK